MANHSWKKSATLPSPGRWQHLVKWHCSGQPGLRSVLHPIPLHPFHHHCPLHSTNLFTLNPCPRLSSCPQWPPLSFPPSPLPPPPPEAGIVITSISAPTSSAFTPTCTHARLSFYGQGRVLAYLLLLALYFFSGRPKQGPGSIHQIQVVLWCMSTRQRWRPFSISRCNMRT